MPTSKQAQMMQRMMAEWWAYQKTEEFQNSKKWAANPQHLDGSLLVFFAAGFNAASERKFTDAE